MWVGLREVDAQRRHVRMVSIHADAVADASAASYPRMRLLFDGHSIETPAGNNHTGRCQRQ